LLGGHAVSIGYGKRERILSRRLVKADFDEGGGRHAVAAQGIIRFAVLGLVTKLHLTPAISDLHGHPVQNLPLGIDLEPRDIEDEQVNVAGEDLLALPLRAKIAGYRTDVKERQLVRLAGS